MFTKLVSFLKGLPHAILPNPDWKKIAWSAGAGVVSFFVIQYALPLILSQWVTALAGGVAVAWVVYTRVAMWEIEKVISQAKDVVK